MNAIYTKAIDALLGVIKQQAQKMPVTGENLQQAILDVEIALDRASTEAATAGRIAELLNLRGQLLSVEKLTYYAQPCQY